MDAEVDQAPATRELRIPEPSGPRSVSVVEGEVGGEGRSEFRKPRAERLHRCRVPVRQVDAKETVGALRRVEHSLHFHRGTSERLLAENRLTGFERADTLISVQSARSCNHHP